MIINVLVCREHVKDVTNITMLGDNITVVYVVDVRNELAASNTVFTYNNL